jgi:hypothetical protein
VLLVKTNLSEGDRVKKLIQIFIVCSLSGIIFVGCGKSPAVSKCETLRGGNISLLKGMDTPENTGGKFGFAEGEIDAKVDAMSKIDCSKYEGSEKESDIQKWIDTEFKKIYKD